MAVLYNVWYSTGGIQLGTSSGGLQAGSGLQSGSGLKLGTGYDHI